MDGGDDGDPPQIEVPRCQARPFQKLTVRSCMLTFSCTVIYVHHPLAPCNLLFIIIIRARLIFLKEIFGILPVGLRTS